MHQEDIERKGVEIGKECWNILELDALLGSLEIEAKANTSLLFSEDGFL